MRGVERVGQEVVHRGGRLGFGRQPMRAVLVEIAVAVVVGVIWTHLTSPMTAEEWQQVGALGGPVLLVTVGTQLFGRITITTRQIVVHSWRGARTIPRADIGHGVHIEHLAGPYVRHGFVALFDHMGTPVLRLGTTLWSEETVSALLGTAPRVVAVGSLDASEVQERWPGLLPWAYRQDARSLRRFTFLTGSAAIPLAVLLAYVLDELL